MKNRCLIIIHFVLLILMIFAVFCSTPAQSKYALNEELYGNPYGKDYRGHVGDGKYQILHIDYDSLMIMKGKNWGTKILEYEYGHSFDENEILYFYSADGFAVVYPENNLCKVLITPPDNTLVVSNGNNDPIISGRSAENNYCIHRVSGEGYETIEYLDTFDQYTEYEQKILNNLIEKYEKSERIIALINSAVDFLIHSIRFIIY